MKTTVLVVFVALACGGPLHAQTCSLGRVVKDLNDPYGGANDLNGDGAFDLSDMVYGLQFLFSGGSVPCPLIVPRVTELAAQVAQLQGAATELEAQVAALQASLVTSEARVTELQTTLSDRQAKLDFCLVELATATSRGLPDTGQTRCYGFDPHLGWVPIPCGEAACPGQDGWYATGCPTESRFVGNQDGTVTDTCRGLMWQKDTADSGGPGPWCAALQYCENLSFAGHDDWRLPNVRELQSIVDYGRFVPAIDPVFTAATSWHWSSTAYAGDPTVRRPAWAIDFSGGYVDNIEEGFFYGYVRAVRDP